MPIAGYSIYLLCGQDGSHFVPSKKDAKSGLWANATNQHVIEGVISTASVIMAWSGMAVVIGLQAFLYAYVPSMVVFHFLLFTVTYLQHHSEDTEVFDDSTWSYVEAAFHTIDRKFGTFMGISIDDMHHNITDCHLVHHLFFTGIPHYNLKKATSALVEYLAKENVSHLRKTVDNPYFYIDVFRQHYHHHCLAQLTSEIPDDKTNVGAKTE